MVSVVMTTYNGEKYILEQLESIVFQTTSVDEIIICDDCSCDNTIQILKRFSQDNPNVNIKIFQNQKNIGWKRNFIQAIQKAKGDYIFLADQDDIWIADKVEKMLSVMIENPVIEILATNYYIYTENDQSYPKKHERKQVSNMKNDGSVHMVEIDKHFYIVGRPGCTYCIKKSFFNSCLKFWNESLAHDALLWIYGIMKQSLFIYEYRTIRFRRHNKSVTGHANFCLDQDERIAQADIIKGLVEKVYAECELQKAHKHIVEDFIKYEENRKEMFSNQSLKEYISIGLHYGGFIYSLKSYFKDFLIIMKGRINCFTHQNK